MKKAHLVFICSAMLAAICSGCVSWILDSKTIPETRGFPKRPNFSIHPKEQPQDNGLDFNAVYCRKGFHDLPGGRRVVSYNFMRFWPSGHVYIRPIEGIPSLEDAESFYRAYVGFYEMDGEKITLELYSSHWGYLKSWGTVSQDSIHIHVTEQRNEAGKYFGKNKMNKEYFKHPVDGLSREPDWSHLPFENNE